LYKKEGDYAIRKEIMQQRRRLCNKEGGCRRRKEVVQKTWR
jgi:hypothetical protein